MSIIRFVIKSKPQFALFVYLFFVCIKLPIAQVIFAEPLSERKVIYEVYAKINPEEHVIEGEVFITWKNFTTDTINDIYFLLYLNTYNQALTSKNKKNSSSNGSIELTSIQNEFKDNLLDSLNFIPSRYAGKHNIMAYCNLNKPIFPRKDIELRIGFKSQLPKLNKSIGYTKNAMIVTDWLPTIAPYYNQKTINSFNGWFIEPLMLLNKTSGEFAIFKVELTLPANYMIGTSGVLINEEVTGNNEKKMQFRAEDITNFCFVLSKDFEIRNYEIEGTNILFLSQNVMQTTQNQLINIFSHLTKTFGNYPYKNLTIFSLSGIKEIDFNYPSIFAIPDHNTYSDISIYKSAICKTTTSNYINQMCVTNSMKDRWLPFGLIDYITNNYFDISDTSSKNQPNFLAATPQNSNLIEYLEKKDYIQSPFYDENFSNPNLFRINVELRPSLWFQSFSKTLGKEAFNNSIKTFFKIYPYNFVSTSKFLDYISNNTLIDSLSKQNPRDYFEQLINNSHCDFYIESITNTNYDPLKTTDDENLLSRYKSSNYKYLSTIRLVQTGDVMVPVDIKLRFADDGANLIKWTKPTKTKEYKILTNSKLVSAEIDPEKKILFDENPFNNKKNILTENPSQNELIIKILFLIQNINLLLFN